MEKELRQHYKKAQDKFVQHVQKFSKIGSVGYWIDDQTELALLAYSRPNFKRTGNETNTKQYMLVVYRNGKEINSLKDELISFSNKAIEQSLKESIKQMYSQHID